MPDDMEQRLRTIERENTQLRSEIVLLRAELQHLAKSVDSLNAILAKIAWLFAGGFAVSFVAFVVGGGLAN